MLVITIIVMIILATAIILALNSSNLTSKANWAKLSSDKANLQAEYVSVLAKAMSDKVDGKASMVTVTELKKTPEYQAWAEKVVTSGFAVQEPADDNNPAGIRVVAELTQEQMTAYDLKFNEENNEVEGYDWVAKKIEVAGIVVPNGFTISIFDGENTVEEGVVIYKTDALTLANYKGRQEEAQKTFDQFVWVPVSNMDNFVRTDWKNNAPADNANMYKYTEPSSYLDYSQYKYETEDAEYNLMRASVEKYGGFYIGRYEAGDGSATQPRPTYVTGSVVLRKGSYGYNYVGWGASMSDIESDVVYGNYNKGKGAVYLSQNMYPKNNNYVTNLIYGVQYDAACRWLSDKYNITDSRSWGNHSDSIDKAKENCGSAKFDFTTGRSEAWKAKNIYDLAGNFTEWTMEAYQTGIRVVRGGNFAAPGAAGHSGARAVTADPTGSSNWLGFRPVLYVIQDVMI